MFASSATAVSSCTTGASCQFELDGNALVDHAGAGIPDDWSRIFDPGTYGASSAFATDFTGGAHEAGSLDTSYFSGSNKDIDPLSSWQWSPTGNNQDKDDLTDTFGAAYTDPVSQHTIAYFGGDRFAQKGDAQIGFWFLQNPVCLNPNGTFQCDGADPVAHSNGDILVVSNFTNGGGTPTIAVYAWQNGALNLAPVSTGTECAPPPVNPANEPTECAVVNDVQIDSPWPYVPKAGVANKIPPSGFFEGGIDLTKLFSNAGFTSPPCFTSFVAETRSSQEPTATLEDLALGTLDSCGSIELKKTWVGPKGNTTIKIGTTAGGSEVDSATANGADADREPIQQLPDLYVSETSSA